MLKYSFRSTCKSYAGPKGCLSEDQRALSHGHKGELESTKERVPLLNNINAATIYEYVEIL